MAVFILQTAGADFVVILKLHYLLQINELKSFTLTMEALLNVVLSLSWFLDYLSKGSIEPCDNLHRCLGQH